nr:uncharacterized protein LOC107372653 [Nothobranchius furzeri]
MGGPQITHILPLLVVWMVCSSLSTTTSNTTHGIGQDLQTPENSTASIPNNGSQESCRGVNLQDASRSISAAVDTFVERLSCKRKKNASLPEDFFTKVEQNLRGIVESSLNVFLDLDTTASGADILELFGILNSLSLGNLSDPTFVQLWFSLKMSPFLPYISESFLIQLGNQNFTCSSFQQLVKSFSNQTALMDMGKRQEVFTNFVKPFLTRTDSMDPGCILFATDIRHWLHTNLGSFSDFATLKDLQTFWNFNYVEVADLLSFSQLTQLAAIPSQIITTQDVTKIMNAINTADLGAFFDIVSPLIEAQPSSYTQEVKSAFLQEILDRASLSSPAVSDDEFLLWLRLRMRPFLVNLPPGLVTPLFSTATNRSCNINQEMIQLLDQIQITLSNYTKTEIYNNIVFLLQGPTQLKCYNSGSFYIFLQNSFLSFGFPDLTTFVSLLPLTRKSEILNTISTSEIRQILSQPGVMNGSLTCVIFNNYYNSAAFLESVCLLHTAARLWQAVGVIYKDNGHAVVLLDLDLMVAFDTIDHQILLNHLEQWVGLYGDALQWMRFYLPDRSICVSMGTCLSEDAPLKWGVPQGSVLGPLLFSLYLLPLEMLFWKHNREEECTVENTVGTALPCPVSNIPPPKRLVFISQEEAKWCSASNLMEGAIS